MTKRLTLTLMLLFTFIVLSACTPIKSVPVRTTEKVVEKLVPYRVEGASAVFLAHFECDSLSRFPRMTVEEDSVEGRMSKEINYQEGTLKVQNFVPPWTVQVPEKVISIEVEKPYPVEVEKIVFRQRGWQKALMWIGAISLILLILKIILKTVPLWLKKR